MIPAARSARIECALAIAIATGLVVLRAAVPLVLERSLDSDQAIVGLMAKHLSEFTAFPLFFYGQHYMLGVQAWIAAPFYWLGGPTPVMLRLPLLLINIGVVVGLILTFRRLGLRPALGLVATLPLITTTPIMSDALMRPLGAAIEPFAWVLVLWGLRRRPIAFGIVLCIACLHREFAVFAAPAAALALWREGTLWTKRQLAGAAVGFAATWGLIDLLKRSINLYGPSGGDFAADSLLKQSEQISQWLTVDAYASRVGELITVGFPDMFGAHAHRLDTYHGVISQLTAGSLVAGLALGAALLIAVMGIVSGSRRAESRPRDAFTLYLGIVGVLSIAAYGLNGGIQPGALTVIRYALMVLFLPVAVLSAFFLRESRAPLRAAVVALTCVWAGLTAVDAGRIVHEYRTAPPANPHREMADYLVREGVRYGRAQYWDAYIITFLSQERVIVASMGKVRISRYRAEVEAHAGEAVDLERQPCEGPKVSVWCVLGQR